MANPLVSVCCLSFNHAPFIQACLDGINGQRCDFEIEVIIHDDASSDSSPEIIHNYVFREGITKKAICQSVNQYSKSRTVLADHVYPHARGKYIALCECDDYWIDPCKLQKQVDFLESHPDYTMCFHNAWNQYEQTTVLTELFSKVEDKDYTSSYILANWIIPTASVMYRKEVIADSFYKEKVLKADFMFGDTPLFLSCARVGRIRGLSDVMSVYRRHDGGVSRGFSLESYARLAQYSEKLGQVFEMEGIGSMMACRALFDGYCLSIKNREIQWSMLYRAVKVAPSYVIRLMWDRFLRMINK